MDPGSATATLVVDGARSRAHTERLQDIFARGLLNLDVAFTGPGQKLGLTLWQIERLSVLQGMHSPCAVDSRAHLQHSDDLVFMWGMTAGRSSITQRGRDSCGDGGHAVLVSCAERLQGVSATTFHPLSVRLPRGLLSTYLPACEDRLVYDVAPDSEPLKLLRSYLPLVCTRAVMHSPTLAEAAAHHVAELVALSLTGPALAEQSSPGVAAARVHAIRRWVARHFKRPGLGVPDAARELQLSPRYIQALLHAQGTSIRDLILEQRLQWVHQQLARRDGPPQRISGLAYAVGFTDLSYFNHAFRGRFGCAPREVLARSPTDCADRQ